MQRVMRTDDLQDLWVAFFETVLELFLRLSVWWYLRPVRRPPIQRTAQTTK